MPCACFSNFSLFSMRSEVKPIEINKIPTLLPCELKELLLFVM